MAQRTADALLLPVGLDWLVSIGTEEKQVSRASLTSGTEHGLG